MHDVDEFEMIRNLPENLRRDIKYHLYLDLVKKITREGDPVQRMLFVVSPPPFHRAPPTLVLNARDARNHGGFRARG
ncbi:hypothetical protein TIFTF001_039367 [Ficus carica]|uniref:Uncharacterized protein n=1 Tax=Ficus carica TaxID=3494 RepID=A0AA88JAZ0_FICCA|nr:hypothetical protein TIFTF001_039367 [Ficus carica]